MTKREVLQIFYASAQPVTPDFISAQFVGSRFRSSVYSYLMRLHKQGLLNRGRAGKRIVYSISPRGIERLRYLNSLKDGI